MLRPKKLSIPSTASKHYIKSIHPSSFESPYTFPVTTGTIFFRPRGVAGNFVSACSASSERAYLHFSDEWLCTVRPEYGERRFSSCLRKFEKLEALFLASFFSLSLWREFASSSARDYGRGNRELASSFERKFIQFDDALSS